MIEEKETNWADKSGKNSIWLTPDDVLGETTTFGVRCYFGGPIPLDPCTEADNPTKALRFFTAAEDGLQRAWDAPVFVNPPYSKSEGQKIPPIRLWIAKIHAEAQAGLEIIALLPCGARFSTGYWQDHALVKEMAAVCFIRGRVPFIDGATRVKAEQNTYDSMIYGFNVDLERFRRAFSSLGRCFSTKLL